MKYYYNFKVIYSKPIQPMKKSLITLTILLTTINVKAQHQKFDEGFIQVHKDKQAVNPLLFENKGVAKPISIIPWKQKELLTIKKGELLKVMAYEIEQSIYFMYFVFDKNTNDENIISIYEIDAEGKPYIVFSEPTKEYEDVENWHFFNRSTVLIIDGYLYFDMSSRENYDNYYKYRYELGSKSRVENEEYLDNYQETMNQTYNHKHTVIAEAMNGELSLEYLDKGENQVEFITKDFKDGFVVGNLSWSIDDKTLYFDNHSTGLACIWRYDITSKELGKIVPEHKAEQAFGFNYQNREYIIYIESKTIKLATP